MAASSATATAQPQLKQNRSTDDKNQSAADEWFERGRLAYERRDYVQAAVAFEHAQSLVPHSATAYNAAAAWAEADRQARAANAFHEALVLGDLREKDRLHAEQSLRELRKQLGLLGVDCPKDARVAVEGSPHRGCPFEAFVNPGTVELSVQHDDGGTHTLSASAVAGQREQISIRKQLVASKLPEKSAPPQDTFPWAYVALGGAAAASGIAIVTGLNGLDALDEFEASGRTNASARQRAIDMRTYTNLAWAGAAVLGTTGAVLLFGGFKKVDSHEDDSQATSTASWIRLGTGSITYGTEF